MDPLSEVLMMLKPQSYLSAGLDAGGDWSLWFPAPDGIKFNTVLKGDCWVSVEGDPSWNRIETGDCFLLTRKRPFFLASDPDLTPEDSGPIYKAAGNGYATCNGGGDFYLAGGRFTFSGSEDLEELLFGMLPPVIHIPRSHSQASVLRWSLDQFAKELQSDMIGGHLMAEHLFHLMLLQALRLYFITINHKSTGWLFALSDRQLGRALSGIHSDPGHSWTLQELAILSGMSRSLFAEKFKTSVGMSPIEYLTRWRMMVAANRLSMGNETVSEVAYSLGYKSESSFSTAFKRIMDCSPIQYKKKHD